MSSSEQKSRAAVAAGRVGSFVDPPRPKRHLQTALRITTAEAKTLDRLARILKVPDRSAVLRHGIDALIRSLPVEDLTRAGLVDRAGDPVTSAAEANDAVEAEAGPCDS